MTNPWGQLSNLLFSQAPLLIVYSGGVILSLVMWGRHPRPALLALLGCAILLLVTLAYPFVQASMMTRLNAGMTATQYGTAMSMIGMLASIVRAAGFILLLCGVFAARQPQPLSAFPVGNPGNYPPPLPTRS